VPKTGLYLATQGNQEKRPNCTDYATTQKHLNAVFIASRYLKCAGQKTNQIKMKKLKCNLDLLFTDMYNNVLNIQEIHQNVIFPER